MSTVFHPQMDGQMEVVNRIPGNMLCSLVKSASAWELVLTQSKFSYNNSFNLFTGLSPFQICTCYKAPTAWNLAPLPPTSPAGAPASEFALYIKTIHKEVRKQLETYASVKAQVDPHQHIKVGK